MPAKHFIVAGMPRAAATLLVEGLDRQPGVRCAGELLHHHREHAKNLWQATEARSPEFGPVAITWIRGELWPNMRARKAKGFKFLDYQIEQQRAWNLLIDRGVSVIHVLRNPIAVFVSMERARRGRRLGKQAESRDDTPIHVDPKRLSRYIGATELLVEKTELFSVRRLVFTYREIIQDYTKVIEQACRFLGVSAKPAKSRGKELHPGGFPDRVANWEDVRENLPIRQQRYLYEELV